VAGRFDSAAGGFVGTVGFRGGAQNRHTLTQRVYCSMTGCPATNQAAGLSLRATGLWMLWSGKVDLWQLSDGARRTLRRLRRRPRLITAFWKQSSLLLE
jgi:hypothetical protein